ncbi:hypothetical protein CASFOL_002779 [Castilleja foliolosa]|uniref:Protein WUSCHEL n=1 Tax=Castilleja foliolosa TaxID=1961234 RepID=A0ABD3EF93_9LAMI
MCPSSNRRWCPTPEQVMILEELYRRGLKTPSAAQIQRITAHLALYGKIQGKNVFYWFQNHKARDRQKLKKKLLANQLHQTQPLLYFHHHLPTSPYFQPFPQTLLHAQGTTNGVCDEEAPAGSLFPIQKEWLNGSYGRDSTMIMEVGPTMFPCCSTRNKPLQTLDLFPLTPPTATTHDQSSSTS